MASDIVSLLFAAQRVCTRELPIATPEAYEVASKERDCLAAVVRAAVELAEQRVVPWKPGNLREWDDAAHRCNENYLAAKRKAGL